MWGGFNSFRDPTRNAVLTSRFMEEDLKRGAGKNGIKEGTHDGICHNGTADRNDNWHCGNVRIYVLTIFIIKTGIWYICHIPVSFCLL